MYRYRFLAILLITSILLTGLVARPGTAAGHRDLPLAQMQRTQPEVVSLAPMVQADTVVQRHRPADVHPADGPPVPLPRDCDGVTPPGEDPPICCVYGYVYYNGEPVAGANVHIESPYGALDTTTASGGASGHPYYQVDLSSSPLSATVGTLITFTVTYSGASASRTWTVVNAGQQVDMRVSARYAFELMWGSHGSGDGQFDTPSDIAVDANGYIYVADRINRRVQKFDSSGNFVLKWGSYGSDPGQFWDDAGIWADSSGYVYTTEVWNYRVQKFDSDGNFITMWGSHGSGDGQFDIPHGIVVSGDDRVYVADSGNCRVQVFTTTNGITYTFAYKWGTCGTGNGQFVKPSDVALDSSGNVYVTDGENACVQKFDSGGNFITKWGTSGSGPGQFNAPGGIAVDADDYVYVADPWNNRIQIFDSSGNYVTEWGSHGTGNGEFNGPCNVTVDPTGAIYVADTYNHRIQKFVGPLGGAAGDWIRVRRVRVTDEATPQEQPAIAFVNNHYFVAYAEIVSGDLCSGNHEVFVREFDADWNLVREIQITDAETAEQHPGIGFANNKFSVVYSSRTTACSGNGHVFVKEYDTNWNLLRTIQLTDEGWLEEYPSLLLVDGYYYVGYNSYETGSSEIYIKQYDTDWNFVRKISGLTDSDPDLQEQPKLCFANNQWAVTYISRETGTWHVYVRTFDVNWNPIGKFQVDTGPWGHGSYIACADDRYFITYASHETDPPSIFINRYTSDWSFDEKEQLTSGVQVWDIAGATHLAHINDMYLVGYSAVGNGYDVYIDIYSVSPLTPTAVFTATPLTGPAPLDVQFTDQSTGDITSWTWDFGDGSVSGARHPSHTYGSAGTYTVSLTVSGPGGTDTLTRTNYIAVYTFEDVTIAANVAGTGGSHGVAWGDYDSDGDLDLYVTSFTATDILFRNNGDGTFTDVTTMAGLAGRERGRTPIWGDYDNDGDLDLYVTREAGLPADLWHNDGDGTFTNVTTAAGVGTAGGMSAAWGDYDRDGFLDILVARWGGTPVLYHNNGNGTFTDRSAEAGLTTSGYGIGAIFGDYDGDGDSDIYLTFLYTDNVLYRNNGNGTFTDVTASAGVSGGGGGEGPVWGDYDNDGDLDLYVVTDDGYTNLLYQNNGDMTFTEVAAAAGVADTGAGRGAAWGDYDNDGWLDLAVLNWGGFILYHNNGDGTFSQVTADEGLNPSASGNGLAWGDYDNDGDLDLYLTSMGSANYLYRNNGGDNWLTIKTVGTLSNRSGIGTRIQVVTDRSSQVREVSGGSGFHSQDSLPVEFGLGAYTGTVTVTAYWPSGRVQTITKLVTNRVITVTEPTYTPVQAGFTALPLSGVAPLTVTFTNTSTGDYTTSLWDFGDGVTSTLESPLHTYESAGTYTVSLTVSGPGGSDTEIKTDYISVSPAGSPPVASISFIWYPSYPDPAIQGHDTIYFNGSGYDTDEGGAYITTYVWTSSLDGQLSTQEDFTVQASELSVGTHTITFQVQDDEGEWSQEVTRTLTVQAGQADVRTLILVNRQKLEELYSASEADQVMNKLNELAAHDSVKGLVVQVENDAAVAAAYAAWDADPTSTARANAVTAAIKDVVDAQWAAHPDLEYLVIVGDDRVIPFRRVLDQTSYPESNYGAVSPTSTTGAALRDDMTLTDDYYADAVPTVPDSPGWDGHDLYIPDLGIGRLIETPAEIIAQIDTFLADDGLTTSSAIVTGYDFVKDGAQVMCDELRGDGITTDCTLIGEHWDRDDFITQVLNTRHGIVSINGHANHYIIGSPSGHVYSSDVAGATADHTRAIFYTLGCHSGLNVPPTNPYEPLDTAQALIQHQANYIANTGYGWGSPHYIALSEQLMLDFTERLVYGRSATIGQALAAAKQEYYLNEGNFDYYDEKIMIESTLYGLPMYRYTTPTATAMQLQAQGHGATAIKEEQVTVLGNGLTVNSLSYQFPALTAESTDDGLYYTFDGLVHTGDGEPIQPKYTADLSFPETKAHGVVFKGGVYTDVASFNPVVDQAVTETTTLAEPAFSAPGWYPSLLHRLNRLERGDKLVTLLGQFNPNSQTERLYEQLSFDIYYHTSSDDWTPPSITSMSSGLGAGTAIITVGADDASGIEAVIVAYTDGNGTWASTSLTESGEKWSGSFPASADTEFFVQVVDKAGNVAVSDNNGRYFKPGDSLFAVYLPLVLKNP